MKKKIKNFAAFIMILFASCAKESTQNMHVQQNDMDKLTAAIAKLGFATNGLQVYGDTVIVENDIVLFKSKLFDSTLTTTIPRQATAKQGTLEKLDYAVWISENFLDAEKEEIKQGVLAFLESEIGTSIGRGGLTSVTFPTSAIGVDCSIHPGTLSPITCGRAEFPTVANAQSTNNLRLGRNMEINIGLFRQLNASQKKYLIAHEFGHMMGFRHTNWRQNGEAEFDADFTGNQVGAYTVPGTANSTPTNPNPDPLSIFNAAGCGTSFTGFTSDDLRAIIFMTNGSFFAR